MSGGVVMNAIPEAGYPTLAACALFHSVAAWIAVYGGAVYVQFAWSLPT